MLFSRRNHGTKQLLQDATRASSRVAEQAQQTLSALADDSRTLAGTARTELGDLSREVRDQASGKVTRARRRTARKLSKAAEAVEPTGKSHRGRPVVKAALAAAAGWLLVNVARKARQKADGASTPSDTDADATNATKAEGTTAAKATESTKAKVNAAASSGGGPAERHTSEAKPAGAGGSATKANANTSSRS
jgi:hypothetical protein